MPVILSRRCACFSVNTTINNLAFVGRPISSGQSSAPNSMMGSPCADECAKEPSAVAFIIASSDRHAGGVASRYLPCRHCIEYPISSRLSRKCKLVSADMNFGHAILPTYLKPCYARQYFLPSPSLIGKCEGGWLRRAMKSQFTFFEDYAGKPAHKIVVNKLFNAAPSCSLTGRRLRE